MMRSLLVLLAVLGVGAGRIDATGEIAAAAVSGAQLTPIGLNGFAGSSVNVVAGLQNTLFTHDNRQIAAFYDADGWLVLAERRLPAAPWRVERTRFRGRVEDAHNTVAIVVDGDGFLHVAWDHHGNPLNYARSVSPGSLELGPKQAMTGHREENVTYPQFLRQPDGGLLFFYRDGRSGRGNLALKAYSRDRHEWKDVHDSLIDGEGQRSAYPAMMVDDQGVLHLAWNWRDTPDVATNHDLCYARSADGGHTWTTTGGQPLRLPLSVERAEYALRLPKGRSMMNPPSLAVDSSGRPCLANYWRPDGSDVPQYHVVRYTGGGWEVSQVTRRMSPFELAGTATKRPPISRSALFFSSPADQTGRSLHLIYRDDELGGRIIALSCADLDRPDWRATPLTEGSVGAWEPALDPQRARGGAFHALVQYVEQQDGNDRERLATPATPVYVLEWLPRDAGTGETIP